MISFGQIIILLFFALLLFGDIRKIFNRIILLFINFKTLFKEKKNSHLPSNKTKD